MKLDRKKNTLRNVKWGTINKIIEMFAQFIVRAIIIKVLGSEYLGLSGLFTSILQVLNMTELGFSTAMVFSMYKPIAEDDTGSICALLALYKKVYRVIGSVIFAIGILILPALPHLIEGDCPSDINIYFLYLIYLANTVLSYFLFSYKNSLLTAHQREDISDKVNTVLNILQYCMQVGILFIWENYYAYIIVQPVITLLNNLIKAYWAQKRYPNYICQGKLRSSEIKAIEKQVGGLMISKVASTLRNSLDNIFLSAYMGLVAVSIYSNYYYIMAGVHSFLTIICNSMQAGVGNSIVTESKEKNYEDMLQIHFVYMWISGWCVISMLCLYQPFMKLWVGENMMFSNFVMVLFCVYMYILCMGDVASIYISAIGKWWEFKYKSIAEIIMNLVLNWLLVRQFGVQGIIVATIISRTILYLCMSVPYLFKFYFKNTSMRRYYFELLYMTIITGVVGVCTYKICKVFNSDILYILLICIFIPNLMFWFLYKPMGYSNKICCIFKKMLRRA